MSRKMLRKSQLAKLPSRCFRIEEKIFNADEKNFLGKAKKMMKKIRLLDDYEKHHFNFLEVYLIGLRAMSRDYKKGIFDDSDCDIAIHPDVLHIKRLDVTRTRGIDRRREKSDGRKIGLDKKDYR